MKAVKTILTAITAAIVWMACSDSKNRYVDLATGEPVELVKDENTGLMVNAQTHKPVRMYVDTRTHDTIWGKDGKVINGSVSRSGDGGYVYSNAGDIDEADHKVKTDKDGSYKVKAGDYKKKVDDDGDIKIKNGDRKIKIDGETGERKVKKD
jgi:hypothetical protein